MLCYFKSRPLTISGDHPDRPYLLRLLRVHLRVKMNLDTVLIVELDDSSKTWIGNTTAGQPENPNMMVRMRFNSNTPQHPPLIGFKVLIKSGVASSRYFKVPAYFENTFTVDMACCSLSHRKATTEDKQELVALAPHAECGRTFAKLELHHIQLVPRTGRAFISSLATRISQSSNLSIKNAYNASFRLIRHNE